jgi:hypothetical protein
LHTCPHEELEIKNKYSVQTQQDLVEIQRVMYMFYLIIIIMSNNVLDCVCVGGKLWVNYQKPLGTNIIGDNTAEIREDYFLLLYRASDYVKILFTNKCTFY